MENLEYLENKEGVKKPVGLRNIFVNEKGNLNISTSEELGNTPKGKINIEAMDDILLKPGDDISLITSHKEENNQDEMKVRVLDANDKPVELKVLAKEITLMTDYQSKAASSDDNTVLDVNVVANTKEHAASNGLPTKGYLKVRARAIDLRCEEHGGIAILPKGKDSSGVENKVKFEFGGGDGKEVFTMNTDKTSIFTNEYRFKKDGIWKMSTRTPIDRVSGDKKKDPNDSTTWQYFEKKSDDFYDSIDESDETADTNAIIKTANAFNYGKDRHAKITSSGNLEIATNITFEFTPYGTSRTARPSGPSGPIFLYDAYFTSLSETGLGIEYKTYTLNEVKDLMLFGGVDEFDTKSHRYLHENYQEYMKSDLPLLISINQGSKLEFYLTIKESPNINVESGKKVLLKANSDIVLETGKGDTDRLNISECPHIYAGYKITNKGNIQGSDPLLISSITNNLKDNNKDYSGDVATNLTQEQYNLLTGENAPKTGEISCNLSDVIKFINWAKYNWFGPWEQETIPELPSDNEDNPVEE